ncbi:MmgE/PrpD family protein [Pseudochelatococcus sp. B33]
MIRKDVTRALAEWIVAQHDADLPADVEKEATRTYLNWFGCAIGGARHETVEVALRAIEPFVGPRTTAVLGRREKVDMPNAAFLNGISCHVLDYDDTYLQSMIHPGGPAASALAALAETYPVSGRELLHALAIGVEVTCRIANCVYPDHYDRGWHLTGTAGVIGTAAGAGYLLNLNTRQMVWALGIAATQASGLREMFGTMCKSFHAGRAAQNGMTAALFAQAGFDSSERALEAPRGFANVLSTKQDYAEILEDLGTRWEARYNTYKPYACGIVIHPVIDGCQQLRAELGDVAMQDIERVELRVHPLVHELTGKPEPTTELETKFSVYHAAACALLRGDGSPTAFTDEAANDAALVALRRRVVLDLDQTCHEASAGIRLTLRDGRVIEKFVERTIGSRDRPLSDAELDAKFHGQVGPLIGAARGRSIASQIRDLSVTEDAGSLTRNLIGGR